MLVEPCRDIFVVWNTFLAKLGLSIQGVKYKEDNMSYELKIACNITSMSILLLQ